MSRRRRSGASSGWKPIAPGACVTLGDDFRPVDIVNSDLDETNTSWRGGISYKPSSTSLIYANVTKGFKGGSFTPAPFIRTSQITRVQQESVLAYEAGFKTNLSRLAQITGAAFYYDYRNKQITGFVDNIIDHHRARYWCVKDPVAGGKASPAPKG